MIRPGSIAIALVLASCSMPASAGGTPSPKGEAPPLPARVERVATRDTVERDGRIERVADLQVLVRDAAAVAEFGQVAIPFIEGYGEVTFERISIEKPDGQRVAVTNGKVEDINPFGLSAAPLGADFRVRQLTIPGLEPGDRLSYRMTLRQKPLIPGVPAAEFKFIVGPIASEQVYDLDVPADFPLRVWHRPDAGTQWQDLPAAGGRTVRRLQQSGPIPDPGEVQAPAAFEPDVIYSTFRSWEEVGKWWWATAHERFAPDAAVRAEAERLVKGVADTGARIEALHAFVSGQVRYLNVSFGNGRLEPRPAAEVLSSRYGDCKGKHALLAALGAAVGIEVLPVLVHSARSELHDEAPAPSQFDHVISVVRRGPDPSQWLWVDATSDVAPAGQLSPPLRGKRALLMTPQGAQIVKTPEGLPFKTRWIVETTGSIDAAGSIRARVRWTVRSDFEPMLRIAVRASPPGKWVETAKELAKEWSKGEFSDVKAGDPSDLQHPFWLEYAVVHTMTAQTLAKPWTFWIPLPDFDLPRPEDKAGPGEPIVTIEGSEERIERAHFEMPEGMEARAPLSVNLDRPFASYRSTYARDGRILTIERVLQVKERRVPAAQRAAYESFLEGVKADRNQQFPIEAFVSAKGETAPAASEPGTADDLNTAGNRALDAGDARKAADLFRKATEKDPSHKWAWNNLGRALRVQRRLDEAVKAFDRQVEINPYDPYAYGNRGSLVAFELGRTDEGAKDLAKQIEVAPLKPDAYRDLAWIRRGQGRLAEAADLMERAAAANPSDADTLLSLVWARARARNGDVADAAARAVTADGNARDEIVAARALAVGGDGAAAGRMAREGVSKLIEDIKHDPSIADLYKFDRDPLYLGEGWRLIGAAALAAGDPATADRYLTAAFEIAFTEDSALELATLRERQGRTKEAAELREQAPTFSRGGAGSLRSMTSPKDRSSLPKTITLGGASSAIGLRHIKSLPGPPVSEKVKLSVKLAVDQNGRILDVRSLDPKAASQLNLVRDRIVGQTIFSANPDKAVFKLARGAELTCFEGQTCYLGINLLADEVGVVLER